MVTVIENKDFIEGIFPNRDDAEKYLYDHPQKEKCILKNASIGFPFYIVETNYGKFNFFSAKDEILNYIRNMSIESINKKKRTVFEVNENNRTKIERYDERSITIYVIKEPYINETKNVDTMGMFEHYHIEEKEIVEIIKGKNNLGF